MAWTDSCLFAYMLQEEKCQALRSQRLWTSSASEMIIKKSRRIQRSKLLSELLTEIKWGKPATNMFKAIRTLKWHSNEAGSSRVQGAQHVDRVSDRLWHVCCSSTLGWTVWVTCARCQESIQDPRGKVEAAAQAGGTWERWEPRTPSCCGQQGQRCPTDGNIQESSFPPWFLGLQFDHSFQSSIYTQRLSLFNESGPYSPVTDTVVFLLRPYLVVTTAEPHCSSQHHSSLEHS